MSVSLASVGVRTFCSEVYRDSMEAIIVTDYQHDKCAIIIRDSSDQALFAGAVSGFTVIAIQTKMVVQLAKVFGKSISDVSATSIVEDYFSSGSFILSAISTASWLFPPAKVVTGAIDAAKSAQKTEDLGWKVAKRFAAGDF